MGLSKGGGLKKIPTTTGSQQSLLDLFSNQAGSNTQDAASALREFLAGGADNAIAGAANKRFTQQTIPTILGQLGQGAKSSSALNQTLGSSAADLNTDIASQMAQYRLQAAQSLGNLGLGQGGVGAGTQQFGYQQRPLPFWQQALLGGIGAGGAFGGSYLGGR